jgi:phage FluMu gp28-like protein
MAVKINYTRPPLFVYQTAILDCPARYTCTEASTKVGKTASHIVWLFEEALKCTINQSVWWVAPTFSQAKIAFDRMKVQISDRNFYTANETNLIITIVTGAKIHFKTGEKPDNLFGDDVYALVVDEASRCREQAWFALRSTITSTGGKVKFIGNVRGRKNWFHKLCMKAKAGGDKDYAYFKITAYDAANAGMMTKDGRPFIEEIESAKRDLPESVFNELYLAEASEDGSNPFGLKYIAMCCQPTLSTQPSACYGIDLARKVDSVSIIGLDRLGTMSHYHNFTKVGWQQTIDTIRYLPPKPMAMDSTGVGDVVLSQVEQVQTQVEGYIFTQASKQRLVEGLAVAIQSRKIIIADDGDVVNGTGKVRHQLEQFEIEYTRTGVKYSAPEGEHDDDVVGLALAWYKWQTASKMGEISVW